MRRKNGLFRLLSVLILFLPAFSQAKGFEFCVESADSASTFTYNGNSVWTEIDRDKLVAVFYSNTGRIFISPEEALVLETLHQFASPGSKTCIRGGTGGSALYLDRTRFCDQVRYALPTQNLDSISISRDFEKSGRQPACSMGDQQCTLWYQLLSPSQGPVVFKSESMRKSRFNGFFKGNSKANAQVQKVLLTLTEVYEGFFRAHPYPSLSQEAKDVLLRKIRTEASSWCK